jgi:hypothetical protein
MKKIILLFVLLIATYSFAQEITPTLENIATFEGKTVTICEEVTGIHETKGGNALLNFGKPFPDNAFSVVIFKLDRDAFSYNPITLDSKTICITGTVIMYKGKPEIIVKKESEIVIK